MSPVGKLSHLELRFRQSSTADVLPFGLKKRIWEMPQLKNRAASFRFVLVLAAAGMSLSACATKDYVDEQIAGVNSRIDSVDAKAQDAIQRADAAAAAAQGAAT